MPRHDRQAEQRRELLAQGIIGGHRHVDSVSFGDGAQGAKLTGGEKEGAGRGDFHSGRLACCLPDALKDIRQGIALMDGDRRHCGQ
jgi:hypothetical protein